MKNVSGNMCLMAKDMKPISVKLEAELMKRIIEFQKSQPVPPKMSDIVKAALSKFLDKQDEVSDAARRKK